MNVKDDIFFKTKLKDICLSSYKSYNKSKHLTENITENEYNALLELKANKDIIIQKADKGNLVVILDKDIYIDKMQNILKDEHKFSPLNITHDEALKELYKMEQRVIDILLPLKDKGVFDDKSYKFLKPVGSQPGKMYGNCKVHKTPIDGCPPLRPILSAINTTTYNLAKFIVPILEPITKNSFVVKDSFSFVEDLKKQNPKHFMASFDVESLFSNIPLNETIDICVNTLYPKRNMKIKGLTKNEFKNLLELATKESLILFDNKYYRQTDGVAMGSPLGPSLANIFLCHHEKYWLENCPRQFSPEYYRRFVDDIFILFQDKDQVNKFDKYLNSRHIKMNFTNEVEDDLSLNFLDILIKKEQGFITSIYRKPTYSGIYSHFKSYTPLIYKKGLINCLMYRIFHLCSNWSIIHDEIKSLKRYLLYNKYPLDFVDNSIRKVLEKLITKSKRTEAVCNKTELSLILPFLGKQSNIIKNKLTKLFSSTNPNVKFKIIFKTGNKLVNIFSYKDKSPLHIQSLVLYEYTCGSCNATYIGKTKRHFKKRMCEHLGISHLTGKNLKYNNKQVTNVRQHIHDMNHIGTFDNFKPLGYARNDFELLIKESLLITKLKPTLNKQIDKFKLELF